MKSARPTNFCFEIKRGNQTGSLSHIWEKGIEGDACPSPFKFTSALELVGAIAENHSGRISSDLCVIDENVSWKVRDGRGREAYSVIAPS